MIVLVNGLDSTKEHMYSSAHWAELAARGISCLMLDQPGTGEALRLQGFTARIDTEAWAGAAVDYLRPATTSTRSRIGIVGWSLGGYYAPRAAAFEKRFALVVAWGANHNWGAVQRRRLEREGERPVPHYWEHVLWVWGHDDLDTFIAFADDVHLDGVVEQITVPFLIAHGANDRQIPLEYAHRSYEQAVNSPKRELRVFTPRRARPSTSGWTTSPRQHVRRRLGRRYLRRAEGLTDVPMIFVKLPVQDLGAARSFYEGLGLPHQRALLRRADGGGGRRRHHRRHAADPRGVRGGRARRGRRRDADDDGRARPHRASTGRTSTTWSGRRSQRAAGRCSALRRGHDLHRQLHRPGRPRLAGRLDGPAARRQLTSRRFSGRGSRTCPVCRRRSPPAPGVPPPGRRCG